LFHDNILFSSKIPNHFFQNGFFAFPLPANIDTGYGPAWFWYIAMGWQIFGKSLWVNHLLCLPILIATAWFYLKISQYFLPSTYLWMVMLLLWLEPTYLTQSVMATQDVFVVMAFIGGLYSIIYNKKWLLILLSTLLALTSVRGVILVVVLFLNQLVFHYYNYKKIKLQLILPYLIPAVFFILWVSLHYWQTGFLLVREGSPWAGHHQLASFSQMLNDAKFIVWMLLDFGRVFLYIPVFFMLLFAILKKKTLAPKTKLLVHWFLWPSVLIGVVLCLRTNPILHRYFMVCFLLMALLFIYLLHTHLNKIKANIIIAIVIIGLVSGHFWIYPDRITQGWDASLAHLPYYELRNEMINYLKEENINNDKVTTGFPMFNSTYHTNFTGDKSQFITLHKSKLTKSHYVIYSNVCNDFSVEEMNLLQSETFVLQKSFEKGGVKMQLYFTYR